MFNIVEVDMCRPIIEGFKEELLTGEYSKAIRYIKAQKQLKDIFYANFDRIKTADQLIIEMKDKYKKDEEQYILFNILMLWRDEYCYLPWIELFEIFINKLPLYAYKCLEIYQDVRKRELSYKGAGQLRADLFVKWETLKDICAKKGLWVEGFSSALKQISISDKYLVNFITYVDYNLDKLSSLPADVQYEKHNLVAEIKRVLQDNKTNKNFGNWINAILYELDGDLDSSMDWRIRDYRKHKNPMVLVRKLYSIKEFDRLESFLKKELESDPKNVEVSKSLKRVEILKLAGNIDDKELIDKIEDAVFKGHQVPSGERLNQLYRAFDNTELRKTGVSIFSLFKELYPLDHEVNKYYGKMLEADNQIEEAFKNYELMLMSGFDSKRSMADIRMIAISALIHDRYDYAVNMLSRLEEMGDLKNKATETRKLYTQINKELNALMSLYKKINEYQKPENFKNTFKNICYKVEDYDCIGIVEDLMEEEYEELVQNEEISILINTTAHFSNKVFPMKFYIINNFIECLEKDCQKLQRILAIAEAIDTSLYAAFVFACENKCSAFEGIKEAVKILASQNQINATIKASIDILHATEDDITKKFVMLLMTGLFNCSKIIKTIFNSSYDKEKNKKLILEICELYIKDLDKGSYFHMKLGFDLLGCFYIEEAKGYFQYAMNNLSEEEGGVSTSQLMYHVCDLLIRMDKGIVISPADYEKKTFFVKALLSIVKNEVYNTYVSKYISSNDSADSGTMIIINAFRYALGKEFNKAQEELRKIQYDKELYEACEIQISSLLIKNNENKEEAEVAEAEAAITAEDYHEAEIIDDYLKTFDNMDDTEDFITRLLKHTPLLAEIINECQLDEEDMEHQYKVWSAVVERYVGKIEALDMSELRNRSHASLKAAVAAKNTGVYKKFFEYMVEFCEAELERRIKGKGSYKGQAALAYEAHLVWYARYRFYKKHNINIVKSDRKLGYYHMGFFRAFTLMDNLSTVLENLVYVRRISILLSKVGYRFIRVYEREYRYGKEGILNYFNSFVDAIEKYATDENIEAKKISLGIAITQIKKMEEVAEKQFFRREKYDIDAFTNSLLYICNEELNMLGKKPAIKAVFLNQQNIHTIVKDNKLQCSFHFLMVNEGQEKANNLSCNFKIMKDNKLLATPLTKEDMTLREREKLPIGFNHKFEEEGQYDILVETKYDDGPFNAITYSIDVKASDFVFERIRENTYPTAPIDDDRKFFGRKAIVQRIRDRLYDESDNTTFLIYGLRRVGKTSLLNHIENNMKDRFYPIQCDCQNVFDADDTGQLIYQLFVENIVYGLEDYYDIDIDMPSEEDFEKNPLRQLKRFFMKVEKSIGEKSLLLLIDEFDEVVKKVEEGIYSHELFDFIRTKMQHSNKTRFIIAGGEYLLNIMKNKALKISDTAKPLEVGFLEPDEAREMIIKPLSFKGIQCLPESVDLIIRITSGHPYFLTAIGNGLVELLNSEKDRYVIYPDDVERVSEKLLDMTQKSMYEHFWNSLDNDHKKLVVATIGEQSEYYNDYVGIDRLYERMKEACASSPLSESIYKDKIRAVINELVFGRILSMENKDELAVCISVEQLRRWTKRWKSIDGVLYDIQGGLEFK